MNVDGSGEVRSSNGKDILGLKQLLVAFGGTKYTVMKILRSNNTFRKS
jgi:hypothetical protein